MLAADMFENIRHPKKRRKTKVNKKTSLKQTKEKPRPMVGWGGLFSQPDHFKTMA